MIIIIDSFTNVIVSYSKTNINSNNYILIEIPQFDMFIFIVKGFILYNENSSICRAYNQFKNNGLKTNFQFINCEDFIGHDLIQFNGDEICTYTIDDDDPLLQPLHEYICNHKSINTDEFRNIVIGTI